MHQPAAHNPQRRDTKKGSSVPQELELAGRRGPLPNVVGQLDHHKVSDSPLGDDECHLISAQGNHSLEHISLITRDCAVSVVRDSWHAQQGQAFFSATQSSGRAKVATIILATPTAGQDWTGQGGGMFGRAAPRAVEGTTQQLRKADGVNIASFLRRF